MLTWRSILHRPKPHHGTSKRALTLLIVAAAAGIAVTTAVRTSERPAKTLPFGAGIKKPHALIEFYVQPDTQAAVAASSLFRAGDPGQGNLIEQIAKQPQAIWLVPHAQDASWVNRTLTAANGKAVVFVLYAIPDRDCGSYSSGGYTTTAQYEGFVNRVAGAVKGRNAWFVVEPDALDEETNCNLDSAGITQRNMLISYAAQKLAATNSHVYLDAGCSLCQTTAHMAPILQAAGIKYASGFSLNVSGFLPTAYEEKYGNRLSALVGGKHFVVDTSRNGSHVEATTWCNPTGQLLGTDPTTDTNDTLVDAYLWIKSPGQSDGNCGGGAPPSGAWWLQYALGLAGG